MMSSKKTCGLNYVLKANSELYSDIDCFQMRHVT